MIRARLPRICGQLVAEGRQVDAEPAQGLGGHAVIGLDKGEQEVLGVEDGRFQALGRGLGRGDGLLGLLGIAIEFIRSSPGGFVGITWSRPWGRAG